MAEIFALEPEDGQRLHPYARKRFNDWKAEVLHEVPQLDNLDVGEIEADVNVFLNVDEKARATKYKADIAEWLRKCTEIGDGYSPNPYSIWVIHPMSELKRLVRTAYERKAKAEREKAKAEEEDRQRNEAVRHVYPLQLMKDAERYLSHDEQKKFLDAALVAIEIYLEQGDSYLDSYKTSDYRRWLRKINNEKEKERIYLDAQAQAEAFKTRLSQGVEEIEGRLSSEKEAPAVLFGRYCSDNRENRYLRESFADILASDAERKKRWTKDYIATAEAKMQQFIPEDLRVFISTESTAVFFLLPNASYSYRGVPCLDFYFDIFAAVTIMVWVQAGSKEFNGITCCFSLSSQEPELLGFYQIIISSAGPHFWQSLPISIVSNLLAGNVQPLGTVVLRRTGQLTEYEVKGFQGDRCEIPISFERYCRNLGSIEKMVDLGIIKERTAEILELPRPVIGHKESEYKGKGSESKKARAFELFNEGKRPSDSEVKALGIKPASAYRYHQEWKKSQ